MSTAATASAYPAASALPGVSCSTAIHITTIRSWHTAAPATAAQAAYAPGIWQGTWREDRISGKNCQQASAMSAPSASASLAPQATVGGSSWACDLALGIAKSSSYPGYIQGYAYVQSCAGSPYPSECAATAEIQYSPSGDSGTWSNDGDGETKYGCPSSVASVKTKTCYAASSTYYYRTHGIFVIIDDGVTHDYTDNTSKLGVSRIC